MVAQYVHRWRKAGTPAKPYVQKQVTPRHAAILACKPDQAPPTSNALCWLFLLPTARSWACCVRSHRTSARQYLELTPRFCESGSTRPDSPASDRW